MVGGLAGVTVAGLVGLSLREMLGDLSESRSRMADGQSPDALARQVVELYDKPGDSGARDGRLNLARPSDPSRDETRRVDVPDMHAPIGAQAWSLSIRQLATAADDAGDADGTASSDEIASVYRKHASPDGRVHEADWQVLDAAVGGSGRRSHRRAPGEAIVTDV